MYNNGPPPAGFNQQGGPPNGYSGQQGGPPNGHAGPPPGAGGFAPGQGGPQGGPPNGYSGPPNGYGGPQGGPPNGYGGPQGGPPNGYAGPPPGAGGFAPGQGGPPNGFGQQGGPPNGFGQQGGPPNGAPAHPLSTYSDELVKGVGELFLRLGIIPIHEYLVQNGVNVPRENLQNVVRFGTATTPGMARSATAPAWAGQPPIQQSAAKQGKGGLRSKVQQPGVLCSRVFSPTTKNVGGHYCGNPVEPGKLYCHTHRNDAAKNGPNAQNSGGHGVAPGWGGSNQGPPQGQWNNGPPQGQWNNGPPQGQGQGQGQWNNGPPQQQQGPPPGWTAQGPIGPGGQIGPNGQVIHMPPQPTISTIGWDRSRDLYMITNTNIVITAASSTGPGRAVGSCDPSNPNDKTVYMLSPDNIAFLNKNNVTIDSNPSQTPRPTNQGQQVQGAGSWGGGQAQQSNNQPPPQQANNQPPPQPNGAWGGQNQGPPPQPNGAWGGGQVAAAAGPPQPTGWVQAPTQ